MLEVLLRSVNQVYEVDIIEYIESTLSNPASLILTVIDLTIVIALLVYACKMLRNTRAWQLLKGIFILVIITVASNILRLRILNYILSIIMMYGGIMIIVIFQPEIRRGLEQLRS